MGTDITIFIEAYDAEMEKWQSTEEWSYDETCDQWEVPYHKRIYGGRNYRLFAMLAGERNYEEITPFSEPRGLPIGVDSRIRAWFEDDFSRCSYFTLKELLSFDWAAPMPTNGLVQLKTWYHWRRRLEYDVHEEPNGWCRGTNSTIIGEDKAREITAAMEDSVNGRHDIDDLLDGHHRTYVRCTWTRPRYLYAIHFWGTVIPYMLSKGEPEHVRMVFGFW